jgi:DNA-binding GntR family transcriptional regulator
MSKQSNLLKLPEIESTEGQTSQATAYERLRHALMVGAIEPGIAITIQDLSDSLQVSATPVREALRQLSTEKALLTLKNRRIKVPEMTPSRFEELIKLRCTLEVFAAKQALPYISNVIIEQLKNIDVEMDVAARGKDWPSTTVLNQRFHSTLYRANPGQVVMPMIESIWLQLGPFTKVAAQLQDDLYLIDRHKEAIDALHHHDEHDLGAAIEADIRDGVGGLEAEVIEKILLRKTA